MADVATAPTATAAQTRTATSRILGFYLGVGGVKVDVLHDVSNFLTKDDAGRVGIGIGSPENLLHLLGASPTIRMQPTASEQVVSLLFGAAAATDGAITAQGSTGALSIAAGRSAGWGGNIRFITDTIERMRLTSSGVLQPGSDNTQALAAASFRFTTVYLGSNPIVTSDMREKTWRGAASAAELAAAKRIAAELGFYQWNDAVAEKGEDGARLHFGVRAQAVWAIMADEGLIDPIIENARPDSRYAFLCYDEWPAIEAVDEVRDEEGNVVAPAVPAQPGGNRFGVRPDQLALFLIAAQEARLAALEAAS